MSKRKQNRPAGRAPGPLDPSAPAAVEVAATAPPVTKNPAELSDQELAEVRAEFLEDVADLAAILPSLYADQPELGGPALHHLLEAMRALGATDGDLDTVAARATALRQEVALDEPDPAPSTE